MASLSQASKGKVKLIHAVRKAKKLKKARAGCKARAQHYAEEEGLNPHTPSETCGYKALAFAVHAVNSGVPRAAEVVEYLRALS